MALTGWAAVRGALPAGAAASSTGTGTAKAPAQLTVDGRTVPLDVTGTPEFSRPW